MNSQSISVSVVIPNWNGRVLLEKNLPSVLSAFENRANKIIEIIVVDDGSTDDSVAFLRNAFKKDIKIVKGLENKGFASAVNLGVNMAKGSLVCLLNTDVIPNNNFLVSVLSHFNKNETFAVGLHEKSFGPSTAQFLNGYFMHSSRHETQTVHISMWASGGSAVFRKSIWQELHGFDEELFAPFYWEDVDLGYRAWKRGYKVLWEPKANVVHAHESVINTNNFKKRYLNLIKERNELLFIWKNITSEALLKKHRKALLTRALNHLGYFLVIWMALRKRKLVIRRRKRETRDCRLSDESVFSLFK